MKRRGFTVLEMMVTITIVAAGLSFGGKLVVHLVNSQGKLVRSEQQSSAASAAIHRLRVDLESGRSVRQSGVELQIDSVHWSAADNVLIRTTGDRRETFETGQACTLKIAGRIVTASIGDATWSLIAPQGDTQ